eukprot:TRINITY_DN596_c0_g3_i2.p2 TRINITY_DN596_c0_g3~~TRINITY_DN596_c0_g3_i2.p2  ORF type:complete len:111 (-),score=43.34 TRINITY_DN596_c0_g3_i2:33-365(-)
MAFSLKNSLNDEKVADKIDAGDKTKLQAKIDETIAWIEANPTAEAGEYDAKKAELEAISAPIFQKLYGAAGGAEGGMPGGMPGGFPGGAAPGGAPEGGAPDGGISIEEVD